MTDAQDEWVEIYNPNDQPVDLGGYTIFTGATFAYKYTFADKTIIDAHGYTDVSSGNTALSLANSGGAAKIVGPNGQVFDQTTYTQASEGLAWAKDSNGYWQWTTTPTMDAANVITSVPAPVKKAAATVQKAIKASSSKAASKPKSTTKITKVKSATTTADAPDLIAAPTPLPSWLLAVVGVLAVLYACYEYRFDIANKLYQLQRYREDRRDNRA
jgi:hypothetical protein